MLKYGRANRAIYPACDMNPQELKYALGAAQSSSWTVTHMPWETECHYASHNEQVCCTKLRKYYSQRARWDLVFSWLCIASLFCLLSLSDHQSTGIQGACQGWADTCGLSPGSWHAHLLSISLKLQVPSISSRLSQVHGFTCLSILNLDYISFGKHLTVIYRATAKNRN